jgi:hypothetical protein
MKRARQKGHAMLELAASAGVMLACLGGTFQFGYSFYVYNQLVSAVGNGARYASVMPIGREAETAIRNMVVYADPKPAPGAMPVVHNLTPAQVDVEFSPDGRRVRVGILRYKVDALFDRVEFAGRPSVEFPIVSAHAPK